MKIKHIALTLLLAISFNAKRSFAEDQCAAVEVTDESCSTSSIKASLSACGDELIAITKPKCGGDDISFTLKGGKSNYQVIMKKGPEVWGKSSWNIASVKKIDKRINQKSLPKTQHERSEPTPATVIVPAPNASGNEPKVSSTFMFSAYFDVYYAYNFNKPRPATGTGTIKDPQNQLRFYDFYANQLSLNLAEVTIKHVRKETSFLVDLDFGTFADANTQTFTYPASGGLTASTSDEVSKHIGQAVFTYTPDSIPGLVFEFGKMPTHVGLELMKAKDNWNYSRSALFSYGGPFWHTGMHLGYALVPNLLVANTYLYNGWGTMYDGNFTPTYGFQLKWTPTDKLTWIYNYIGGPEQANNNQNWKQVHESNISYSITPTLSAATDFLYGSEKGTATGDVDWYGAQFGFKWQTSPRYFISPRVEFYRDSNGYTLGGDRQTLYTYTLTQSYLLSEGFEVRLEGRLDHSSKSDRFIKGDGTPTANQPTALLSFLYTM